jgi:hypothetical protein
MFHDGDGPPRRFRPRAGVRWVEITVVLGVLAMVVLVVFPMFGHLGNKPDDLSCTSHQKTLALCIMLSANERGGRLPAADTWTKTIVPDASAFRCPQAPTVASAYLYNAALDNKNVRDVGDPATTFVTTDGVNPTRPGVWTSEANTDWQRHQGYCIRSFLDYHVEKVKSPAP